MVWKKTDSQMAPLPFLVLLGSSLAIRKTSSELLSLCSLSLCSSWSTFWITHSKLLSTFSQTLSCKPTASQEEKEKKKHSWITKSFFCLTHSSSCGSACREARLFLVASPPSEPVVCREDVAAAREGEEGRWDGERDGEWEESERDEEEDGDGVLRWEFSGRAAARARMAEDSSLESQTVTSWRACRQRENEKSWKRKYPKRNLLLRAGPSLSKWPKFSLWR